MSRNIKILDFDKYSKVWGNSLSTTYVTGAVANIILNHGCRLDVFTVRKMLSNNTIVKQALNKN